MIRGIIVESNDEDVLPEIYNILLNTQMNSKKKGLEAKRSSLLPIP